MSNPTTVHTDHIGMNHLTGTAAGSGSRAPAGSFRSADSRTRNFSDENERIQRLCTAPDISGCINLQVLQLAQVSEFRRDISAQLVRRQDAIPTKLSNSTIVLNIGIHQITHSAAGSSFRAPMGSFRLTGSYPGSYPDRYEHPNIAHTYISGRINEQVLQLAQVPELRRDRSAQLVRGQVPISASVSKSNYCAHGSHRDESAYSHCSRLKLPSSGGIVPLNWFEDKYLFGHV